MNDYGIKYSCQIQPIHSFSQKFGVVLFQNVLLSYEFEPFLIKFKWYGNLFLHVLYHKNVCSQLSLQVNNVVHYKNIIPPHRGGGGCNQSSTTMEHYILGKYTHTHIYHNIYNLEMEWTDNRLPYIMGFEWLESLFLHFFCFGVVLCESQRDFGGGGRNRSSTTMEHYNHINKQTHTIIWSNILSILLWISKENISVGDIIWDIVKRT